MGRKERKRAEDNDHVRELLDESKTRKLTDEEIATIRAKYTGIGGLVASRWDNGQFFTPEEVTRMVVEMLQIPEGSHVLEPSCGGGAFLAALPEGVRAIGVEMMRETATVAGLINSDAQVHQGDALEMLPHFEGRFDYVIGNPPFCDVRHQEEYQGFEIARSSKRSEWYFIELGLKALRPGGVLAYVVPDGILSNSKDRDRRKWIMDNYWLRGVISLPMETFALVGTTCKTSILVVQKPHEGVRLQGEDYQIFMAIADSIGWDTRGRKTENDLPKVLDAWQKMYPVGLGQHVPVIIEDSEVIDELLAQVDAEPVSLPPTLPDIPADVAPAKVVELTKYRNKPKKQESAQLCLDFAA